MADEKVVNIEELKQDQDKNNFMKSHKDTFISILNRFLDELYDTIDLYDTAVKMNQTKPITDAQAENMRGLSARIEMTRKKLQQDASLTAEEMSEIILITGNVKSFFDVRAKDMQTASQELQSLIDEFLKF